MNRNLKTAVCLLAYLVPVFVVGYLILGVEEASPPEDPGSRARIAAVQKKLDELDAAEKTESRNTIQAVLQKQEEAWGIPDRLQVGEVRLALEGWQIPEEMGYTTLSFLYLFDPEVMKTGYTGTYRAGLEAGSHSVHSRHQGQVTVIVDEQGVYYFTLVGFREHQRMAGIKPLEAEVHVFSGTGFTQVKPGLWTLKEEKKIK